MQHLPVTPKTRNPEPPMNTNTQNPKPYTAQTLSPKPSPWIPNRVNKPNNPTQNPNPLNPQTPNLKIKNQNPKPENPPNPKAPGVAHGG